MIRCQICDKYYKSMQPLSKHITQVHQISKQDYYNKNDFNKNNLLDFIPKAEIVYKSNYYTIYGAGLLYK